MSAPVRQSVTHLPIERLTEHSDNIRETLGELSEMADSIREHGILQPLVAAEDPERPGVLKLLAGHRRLRGAIMAGLTVVPVIIRHQATTLTDDLVLMLVENTQRSEINPVERATAYGRLRDQGLGVTEIARRTGAKPSTVSYYLGLLSLAPEELDDVREGRLSSTKAIALARGRAQAKRTAENRRRLGRPPKGNHWFSTTHRLASSVKASCDHDTVKVGSVGCGPCWERAIFLEGLERAQGEAS